MTNDFEKAIQLHTDALEMRKRLCQNEGNEDIINSLSNIGLVYDRSGQRDKSLEMHKQALEMSRRISKPNSANILTAACLEFYGDSCMVAKKHDEALASYLESYEIKKKVFGESEPNMEIEKALVKIQSAYSARGHFTKGLKYYTMAYEIAKKLYEPQSSNMVEYLNNFGVIHNALGDMEQSLEYYISALEMCKKLNHEDDPIIGLLLINIGAIYGHKGEHTSALKYQLEALEISKKSTNSAYQMQRDSTLLMDIANSYEIGYDYQSSLKYKLEYLELLKKELPEGEKDSDSYARVTNSLSETYKLMNKRELMMETKLAALEMFKRLNEKQEGDTYLPELIDLHTSMAEMHQGNGENDKAIEYYKNVPDMTRRLLDEAPDIYPKLRDEIKKSLLNMIECYQRLGDEKNVERLQVELDKLRNKAYSKACVIS